ncbi:MAG TPA: 2-dehydro-3-deoxygalactonokinase [Nitrospira sp.]|nr:2-dehydro-3-deoxygalactonokinase [Nitrospira sp.]
MGTTTTRVWLINGNHSIHRLEAPAGVRNTAIVGDNDRLKAVLRDLISRQQAYADGEGLDPRYVIGAGMLTSALGLREVPHVQGPISAEDLRNNVTAGEFPDVTQLPVMLVPGVKTGEALIEPWEVGKVDVIRGEETLCVGLLADNVLRPHSSVLNLGSHWKSIAVDQQGRIEKSLTSLSGELMLASQTDTILASSIPPGRPTVLNMAWVKHGMHEEQSSGLARTLFCVRLLELDARTSPIERLSYLIGGFVSQSLSVLLSKSMIRKHVVICGSRGIADAWKCALNERKIEAENYSERTEDAFIRGLGELSRPDLLG